MRCDDWRSAGAEEVAPLYARERERWLSALGWDTSAAWLLAEEGRRTGRTPGLVARGPRGDIVGWTFFSVNRGAAHLGALHGDRADVVRDLLDLVIEAPEAAFARRYQGFLLPGSAAVNVALTRRRFSVVPQRFLVLRLPVPGGPGTPRTAMRAWTEADVTGVVRLLARAYAGTPVAQAFAPDGRLEDWVAYASQLLNTAACGTFLPGASFVVPGETPERPAAAVVTTVISPGVWHIAQVAVDPTRRREGVARQLVEAVSAAATTAGARELTLVVDDRNEAAQSLYAAMGFQHRESLLLAARGRVTRVAARPQEAMLSESK
jgi:ribosomal protein S18 acetylase RimI-like enzyme